MSGVPKYEALRRYRSYVHNHWSTWAAAAKARDDAENEAADKLVAADDDKRAALVEDAMAKIAVAVDARMPFEPKLETDDVQVELVVFDVLDRDYEAWHHTTGETKTQPRRAPLFNRLKERIANEFWLDIRAEGSFSVWVVARRPEAPREAPIHSVEEEDAASADDEKEAK